MAGDIFLQFTGEEVPLVFGDPKGANIRMSIYPVGGVTFREQIDWDCDTFTGDKWQTSSHVMMEADWDVHPEECRADVELCSGGDTLSRYAFPSLLDKVTPEQEAAMSKEWSGVYDFATRNGIDLTAICATACAQRLDHHLEARHARGERSYTPPGGGAPLLSQPVMSAARGLAMD